MLTFIDNEPVSFQGGTMNDEEFTKSDEFKEITEAIQTLAKHCPSLVISGYTTEDHSAFVYNHARGQADGNHMYEVVKKQKGEKAAKKALRGTDLATHITNMLVDAKKQHGVDADAVLHTVQKGQVVMDALSKMGSDDKNDLFDALKKSESPEEALKLMKERIKGLEKPQKRNGGALRDKYQALEDMFVKTEEKEDVDIERLTRTVKLATGAEAKAFKMSDPECVPALAHSLANNLKATAIVGFIRTEKNGDIDVTDVEIYFQDNLGEIADKNGDLDIVKMKIALAGSLGVSIFRTMKENYDLPDNLFSKYMESEKL